MRLVRFIPASERSSLLSRVVSATTWSSRLPIVLRRVYALPRAPYVKTVFGTEQDSVGS